MSPRVLLGLWACSHGAPVEGPPERSPLADSPSAYLREHAEDLVRWVPWGPDAFASAAASDRLVFVTVGFASCHWCHVMQAESFRDPEVSALINARFVPIAVDRELRPDLDQVYLAAVETLTGSAGWPATLVLTPDGQVVFAATYLPPRDGERGAARGLATVLAELDRGWVTDREALVAEASANRRRVVQRASPPPPGPVPDAGAVAFVVGRLVDQLDPEHGGFGRGAKFPRPAALDLVLARGDAARLAPTLDALADGAVHDHVGGGFHRYATDPAWTTPHFEKTTDDNAWLVSTWFDAALALSEPRYAELARETLRSLDQMAVPGGGYGAGLDADSVDPSGRSVEGAFYTWTAAELVAAVGPEGPPALGVGPEGRWAVRRARPIDPGWWPTLAAARSARTPPAVDTVWVVGTNARVVSALVRASRAGDPTALGRAVALAERIGAVGVRPDGGLRHAAGSDAPALLDDQAAVLEAAIDLFVATLDPRWWVAATERAAAIEAEYADPTGGWFRTAAGDDPPWFRPKDDVEASGACGASVAIRSALRLYALTSDPSYLERADRALMAYANAVSPAMPALAEALARRHAPGAVVVVGWPDGADAGPLLAAIDGFAPGREVLAGPASALARAGAPAVADKVAERPTVWVCRGTVCQPPAYDPASVRAALQAR